MLVVVLFVLFPFRSWSAPLTRAQCGGKEGIDYSSHFGPVRNQANSNWCVACSAADLIGFHQGFPPSQQISCLDLALASINHNGERSRKARAATGDWSYFMSEDGTWISSAFRSINKGRRLIDHMLNPSLTIEAYNLRKNACLESELPSQPPRGMHDSLEEKGPLAEILSQDTFSFLEARLRGLGDRYTPDVEGMNTLLDLYSTCRTESENSLAPQLRIWDEVNEAVALEVEKTARSFCRSGPPLKPMKTESLSFPGPNRDSPSAAALAAASLAADMPLMVSYDDAFLKDRLWKPAHSPVSNHVSLIVGMRWNLKKRECEFKLRNSWGASCNHYAPRFRGRCEKGNLWISEKETNQITSSLTRIAPG